MLFIVYRDIKNPQVVGGDIYLWELARGLSGCGHEVVILCSGYKGSDSSVFNDRVKIIRIRNSRILPLRIFKAYLSTFKGRFDYVIEEVIGGQRLPFFASLYVKEPILAVWHQKNSRVFLEQYPLFVSLPLIALEYLLALIYRKKVILTPSEGAKRKLSTLGFKINKIKVIYDGVGENFPFLKTLKNREEIIVCLGKLRKYKRIDQAILGHAQVIKQIGRPVKLVVAGKTSEIDSQHIDWLRNYSRILDTSEHVEFRINISENEKIDLLCKSKVLVQPSPIEGFSIVVIEANRCGTPVVVSNGVPFDVVHDGINGFVYTFSDIDTMTADISKLLNDNDLWRTMSEKAYKWSQKFTWKNSALVLEAILNEMKT